MLFYFLECKFEMVCWRILTMLTFKIGLYYISWNIIFHLGTFSDTDIASIRYGQVLHLGQYHNWMAADNNYWLGRGGSGVGWLPLLKFSKMKNLNRICCAVESLKIKERLSLTFTALFE